MVQVGVGGLLCSVVKSRVGGGVEQECRGGVFRSR